MKRLRTRTSAQRPDCQPKPPEKVDTPLLLKAPTIDEQLSPRTRKAYLRRAEDSRKQEVASLRHPLGGLACDDSSSLASASACPSRSSRANELCTDSVLPRTGLSIPSVGDTSPAHPSPADREARATTTTSVTIAPVMFQPASSKPIPRVPRKPCRRQRSVYNRGMGAYTSKSEFGCQVPQQCCMHCVRPRVLSSCPSPLKRFRFALLQQP